ncbi:MAG: agmatine deiminase family protein [Desulfobacterales bacterium]|nr:agmatine deiminase family protein [Desulfobacterales bacterium]
MKNSIKYKNYVPHAFWSMDQGFFSDIAKDADSSNDRKVLDYYPYKWAYRQPLDPEESVMYLNDIGMNADGKVNAGAVARQFDKLSTFEKMEKKGQVEWGGEIMQDTPPSGFKMVPEWGPMSGVLLNWPTLWPPMWTMHLEIIKACGHVKIYLRVGEGGYGAAALAWLEANGVDLNKVQPIPGPLGDNWSRDYSPLYGVNIYSGEPVAHKFKFAVFCEEYRQRTLKEMIDIDRNFAWKEGYTIYRNDILLDGGAILTDGNGTYVLTKRVLKDNYNLPNLRDKLDAWLNADRIIIVEEEPNDLLGHINHFKFISSEKIIVGQDDKPSPVSRYLDRLAQIFDKAGYEVIRVPAPQGFDNIMPGGDKTHTALYANSLMMNGKVLMCTYDDERLEKYNEGAIDSYQKALPDYEIVPIEATVPGNAGGGINCSSKEIPDYTKLKDFMLK